MPCVPVGPTVCGSTFEKIANIPIFPLSSLFPSKAMLRFTSKCSLLLLALMPRWAYAEFECTSAGTLFDRSKCHVQDVNRVFEGDLDRCATSVNYVSDRRCTAC